MEELYNSLCEKIKKYKPNADFAKMRKAFDCAREAHSGQKRVSGEEYIFHPLEVAHILADIELDETSVVAALLHDVVEDTHYTDVDIVKQFGEEIAIIVDGVTKLGKIQFTNQEEEQVENLRKMFFAMAKDIRVILIKLADRLHNMRTLKSMTQDKQRQKARETLEVYAPLANRLGLSKIKWELEDLSLRYLDPVAYSEISEGIKQKRQERERYVNVIMDKLRDKLKDMGIKGQVSGRAKHFYSIFKKMFGQHKSLDEIYDLFAVRIIVDTISDCYAALGMVHEEYYPLPGRVKDYIAMPKPNMYQSLHTTVIGPNGMPFEIQIRTWDMHRVAEFGIAAHWKYKEGVSTKKEFDSKLAWIRQMLELQKDLNDEEEFMKTLKIDILSDEVFVFTPKGDVINLPYGATPIDFAFAIHSAVGYRMSGAKVNGKIIPLDYTLQNGDIAEILTSSSVHGPSRDWLKIAKTSQARNKINGWFKKERREENMEQGKEMIERELRRIGMTHAMLFKNEWLDLIYKKYNVGGIDDIYAMVGYGGVTANKIISRLREEYRKNVKQNLEEIELQITNQTQSQNKSKSNQGIIVEGIENCLVRLSKCCNPVPGDEIVGYITRGRGVSVHRSDCLNVVHDMVTHNDGNRFINVKWDNPEGKHTKYSVELQFTCFDRRGLLADIISQITSSKLYITATNSRSLKDGMAIINITLEIESVNKLENIVKKLMKINGVKEIRRTHS